MFDGVRVIPERDGRRSRRKDYSGWSSMRRSLRATTVIDGRGKTLMPGLIDAHTHTFAPEHLRAAVVFGVTTELDMFTLASFAAARRAEQAAGKADDRADLFSAGTLVTAPGGHGTEYGLPIPTIKRPIKPMNSWRRGLPRDPITSRSSTTTVNRSTCPAKRSTSQH